MLSSPVSVGDTLRIRKSDGWLELKRSRNLEVSERRGMTGRRLVDSVSGHLELAPRVERETPSSAASRFGNHLQ